MCVLTWFPLLSLVAVHDEAVPGRAQDPTQLGERKRVCVSTDCKQNKTVYSQEKQFELMTYT